MRWSLLAILATLLACGDESTQPSTGSLSGTWALSLSNMSGTGISCSSKSTASLFISQQGATLSGSYTGGELTCVGAAGTASEFIGSGTILNGEVNGNSVSIDLNTPDFHLTGTIDTVGSMSGTAVWRTDFGQAMEVVTLNGDWRADTCSGTCLPRSTKVGEHLEPIDE
jgi:hypothetical protein